MNTPARWDPMKDLHDLTHRLFGRAPLTERGSGHESMRVAEWAPLVDITEDDQEFCIKAELPEVKKEDTKVTVDDGVLTITGERHSEKEEKNKKFHRVERAHGTFARSFTLPEGVDETKVTADFNGGILKVHLPKAPEPKPRSTSVKIG